jgi:hypothetical protein
VGVEADVVFDYDGALSMARRLWALADALETLMSERETSAEVALTDWQGAYGESFAGRISVERANVNTIEYVDEILDSGSGLRYDPIRQSIQVRAPQLPGRPYVVVDSDSGQHIVTAMVPKL